MTRPASQSGARRFDLPRPRPLSSAMRRAIVHIGLPRTGTTTLQRIFCRLRPELAQRGILYPELTPGSAAIPHLSHQHLGEALDGRRPPADRAELLGTLGRRLEQARAGVVLLSYESLCLIPERKAAPNLLRDVFAAHGYAMETILTVKPQAEYLNSTYTWRVQFLREARTFERYRRAEMRSPRLDLGVLSGQWRSASDGRMRAVPVRDRRSDRPLIERFLTELGLLDQVAPLLNADDTALRENRSPGPVTIEVCRRLRKAGATRPLGARARDATRWVEQAARDAGLDSVPFRGLDADAQARIAAHWAASNDRFAQAVWDEPWSARACGNPPLPVNEIAGREIDPATERRIQALFDQACRHHGIVPRYGSSPALDALAARSGNLLRQALTRGRSLLGFR